MDRAVKASLLSALVFPGVGQLYLNRRLRGWLIVLVAAAAVVYFAAHVIGPALDIANEINAGTVAPDPVAIMMRLEQRGQAAATPLHSVAGLVMIVCWIGSTIDAWWLGRRPV